MRLAALLVASISALATNACSTSSDPTTSAYWLERLDQKEKRPEALRELGKIKDKSAVPAVLELFETAGDWQPEAAYALGQLGDAAVVPKLIAALDYQVGIGRDATTARKNRTNQNIARALALLKAKDAVEPLIKLLPSEELKTRDAVISSLGAIGDGRAAGPLIDIAVNEKQAFIRKTAIEALGDLRDPKAVGALIQDLFVELPGVSFYFEARQSLLQIGSPSIPKLMDTLLRKNKEVEAITMPGGETIAEGAIEAKAAFVLGELRAKDAEKPMTEALQKYYGKYKTAKGPVFAGIVGAVMELCYALGTMGSAQAIPLLEKIAADTDPNLRVAAVEALTSSGATAATPTLLKVARTGDLDARRSAIEAASRLGKGSDLAAFEALAKAGGDGVTPEALAPIVAAAKPRLEAAKVCGEDVACWKQKLQDSSPVVRERAAMQLGWAKAGAVPELMKAAEDDQGSVRVAAVTALASQGSGLDADALQAIHDRAKEKVAYKDANAGLKRLIARVRASKQ